MVSVKQWAVMSVIAGILILFVAIVSARANASGKTLIDVITDQSPQYSCQVTIKNPIFFDSKIDSVNCVRDGNCRPALQLQTYTFFSDRLTLRGTTSDGWTQSSTFSVTEGESSKEVTLKPCTKSNKLSLTLTEEGKLVDSEEVPLG